MILGELEDISVEELELLPASPRRTPLKSLLKKSFEIEDTHSLTEEPLTTVRERSCSPRKAVKFSEFDQVKLMSQESLVSTAPSDGPPQDAQTVNATSMTCAAKPAATPKLAAATSPPAPKPTAAAHKANGDAGVPQRNQLIS